MPKHITDKITKDDLRELFRTDPELQDLYIKCPLKSTNKPKSICDSLSHAVTVAERIILRVSDFMTTAEWNNLDPSSLSSILKIVVAKRLAFVAHCDQVLNKNIKINNVLFKKISYDCHCGETGYTEYVEAIYENDKEEQICIRITPMADFEYLTYLRYYHTADFITNLKKELEDTAVIVKAFTYDASLTKPKEFKFRMPAVKLKDLAQTIKTMNLN